MRFLFLLAVAAFGFAANVLAATPIPPCGLGCLLGDTISNSECHSFANTTCLCTNEQVISDLGACVLKQCSIIDALSMQKFSDETCKRPMVDHSMPARIIPPLFGALAVLLFAVRVGARCMTGLSATWRADDWAIVPAVLATIGLVVMCGFLANQGLGFDMWYIEPKQITHLLHLFFWGEVLYIFIIPVTKISVLIFYLQIFPDRFYKRASMCLIVLNALYLLAFVFSTVFQCTPISGAWLTWDGTFKAECRDLNKQVWAAATTSIVLDVAMLVLPMPALWKLNMSIRKKLQVMFMFSLGIFVTIVSVLRLQYIVKFATTRNATQDFVPVGIWSIVEVSVGIICACLPALRIILASIMPRVFGTTMRTGNKYADYTGGSQSQPINSRIRVKSEFTVESRQTLPTCSSARRQQQQQQQQQQQHPSGDDSSSIELIFQECETGKSLYSQKSAHYEARASRVDNDDNDNDVEAAAAAYNSNNNNHDHHQYHGDRHRQQHHQQQQHHP